MPKINQISKSEQIKKRNKEKEPNNKISNERKIKPPNSVPNKRVKLIPQTKPDEIFIDKNKPASTGSGVVIMKVNGLLLIGM